MLLLCMYVVSQPHYPSVPKMRCREGEAERDRTERKRKKEKKEKKERNPPSGNARCQPPPPHHPLVSRKVQKRVGGTVASILFHFFTGSSAMRTCIRAFSSPASIRQAHSALGRAQLFKEVFCSYGCNMSPTPYESDCASVAEHTHQTDGVVFHPAGQQRDASSLPCLSCLSCLGGYFS